MSFGAGGTPLPTQMHAAHWITASARDWKDSPGMATEAGDRNRVDQLPRQMAQNANTWPTVQSNLSYQEDPAKHDARKTRMQEKHGRYQGENLPTLMSTAYSPTPTVADVQGGRKARSGARSNEPLLNGLCFEMEATGPTPTGSPATTAKRGAPNPVFAFWLMGFPAEWISGALEAMRSYRKPRRK